MKCFACGRDYSDDFEFCPFCGSYPKMFCPNCCGDVIEGETLCPNCGGKLVPIEELPHYSDLERRAYEYRENDNFEKSCECFEELLERSPNWEDIYFLLGENYEILGNVDKALEYYEKLSELNPNYVGVWARLGRVYIGKEELEKAKEYLLKEKKANPSENEPYIYSMHICFLEDDFKKANEILDEYFAIGPDEDFLKGFRHNNDLNLELVEYNQELADINERVKEYINNNFDDSENLKNHYSVEIKG